MQEVILINYDELEAKANAYEAGNSSGM